MKPSAMLPVAALALAAATACAPARAPWAPRAALDMRKVQLLFPGASPRALVAVQGQLLPLGKGDLVIAYQGERRLAFERKERLLLLNGEVVGLDLTGASRTEALRLLGRVKRMRLLVWRQVARPDPVVLAALDRAETSSLVLVLGQSLTAPGPFDLEALGPICARLHGLVLEGEVTPRGLRRLGRCEGLRALTLRGALVPDALAALAALPQLRFLDLSAALRAFGPGPLRPLFGLSGLVALDLSNNGLNDQEVAGLGRLIGLQWLRLRGNPVTGATLGGLARLRYLRWLDLEHTALCSAGLARLAGLATLTWLGVGHTAVTARGLGAFRKARPRVVLLAEGGALTGTSELAGAVRPKGRSLAGSSGGGGGVGTGPVDRSPLGVPSCDEYIALIRCYFAAISPTARRNGEQAVQRIRDGFRAQIKNAGGKPPPALAATCAQVLGQMKQALGRVPAAQKCLRP